MMQVGLRGLLPPNTIPPQLSPLIDHSQIVTSSFCEMFSVVEVPFCLKLHGPLLRCWNLAIALDIYEIPDDNLRGLRELQKS